MVAENILQEADRLTSSDRKQEYGDAGASFKRIAAMWSALLNVPIRPEQVALCMAALKLERESYRHKRDNLVDACGYLRLAHDICAAIQTPINDVTLTVSQMENYPVVPTLDL